jgi:NAD(P)-dependent dehydrogenase (short-subunit alcohol dehydrogenase family)
MFGGRYRAKVAIVTGASSGLGRRMALDLARAGALVTGVARRGDLLDELAGRMESVSPGCAVEVCDVADADAFAALVSRVETLHGGIDILVNNAAIDPGVRLAEVDLEDFHRSFDVNFFAAVAGTLAVLPGMMERSTGIVVNVSSDAARLPPAGPGLYPSSKAALSVFTESIWYKAREHGVHLHVVYPAWMPTAMGNAAVERGLRRPPRPARSTEDEVSRLVLAKMGSARLELSASGLVDKAVVLRAAFPRVYRRLRQRW